jgi:Antitoxin-like ribbon-helix-helix
MMARRPSHTTLDDAVAPPSAPQPVVQPKAEQPAQRTKWQRAPSREGKRGVNCWLDRVSFQVLREIAFTENRSVQSLAEEAFDLLFRAHGRHPVAQKIREDA